VTRISDEAIERNRVSSRARYHVNKEQNQKVQKAYRERKFEERAFIGWDGEGYDDESGQHHYMLFGASTGDCVTGPSLGTAECLSLILRVREENPDTYNVGFAFDYDVNMIIKDLPWRHLAALSAFNRCRWVDPATGRRYRIEHIPGKFFRISADGISATIYDCFGFFHSSYIRALYKYGVGDPAKLEHISTGKAARGSFTLAGIENVKSYWLDEISLLPPLMDRIRDASYGGGYRISEWHGPGALASYLLRDRGVNKWHSKKNIPAEVKSAIRHAYAGGRFTGCLCGLYIGDIYTADVNSAYVYATSLLPRMDRGKWNRQNPKSIDARNLPRFGLYHIELDYGREGKREAEQRGIPEAPNPLFHRDKIGVLRWPRKTTGWYWTPEAKLVLDSPYANVLEAWIFDDDGSKPFRFVHDAYDRRVDLQHQGNPAEKAYKWALAAMYGAFARRVGWKNGKPPPSHELTWAGFITSYCRAMVYGPARRAWENGDGLGLISIDTDSITTTVPIDEKDLPNGIGEGLGQWKLEHWTGILQWQNGIYWLRDENGEWSEPKSRGIPRGSVPFEAAYNGLQAMDFSKRPFVFPHLSLERTRFIGYRQALRGQFDKWRKWVTEPVEISMGGKASGKAIHMFRVCDACRKTNDGTPYPIEDVRALHTISPMPSLLGHDLTESQPHKLPWLEELPDLPAGFIAHDFNLIVRDEDM
jgi:hypothetical protein